VPASCIEVGGNVEKAGRVIKKFEHRVQRED